MKARLQDTLEFTKQWKELRQIIIRSSSKRILMTIFTLVILVNETNQVDIRSMVS